MAVGGLPANRTVNGFAVDPTNPKVMYVAMSTGLFKSTDAGANWKSIGKKLKNMTSVAVNPKKPTDIFAAAFEGTVFKSGDGGKQWERLH